MQPSSLWQDRKEVLPAVPHMDPARPSNTGVTWGTAALALRGDRARLQQTGAPHSINADPLDTGWGRHRRPCLEGTGRGKAQETGSRLPGEESWGT